MKKKCSMELAYVLSLALQALGVGMVSASALGLSVTVAPAYIISLRFSALTYGMAEWLFQGILFLVVCVILRKMKFSYFTSFLTAVIYGGFLDLWRKIIPVLNPTITPPGAESFSIPVRILLFVVGCIFIQFTVALSYRPYIQPMVYDFFTVKLADHFKVDRTLFKRFYDLGSFCLCLILGFAFFRRIEGIGIGSLVNVVMNSIGIGFFDRMLEKHFEFVPTFPAFRDLVEKH